MCPRLNVYVASESSVPPPTAAPPTEVVSPLELPPTQGIHLNIPATTFVLGTPRLSRGEVTKLPSEMDTERGFEDLIMVLGELSTKGGAPPRFSTVFSLLRDRKPDAAETAGAAQFKAYLQRAESAGIVAVEQHNDGYWRMTLRNQRDTNSDGSQQHTPPLHAGSRFRDLIQVLNDLRLAGDSEYQFSIIAPRLLRNNPSIYGDAGVTGFEEYIKAAVVAGVVTAHVVRNGEGSLKLHPAYCSQPVGSSTLARAASTSPTPSASTASPFAPLVDFVKSRQLTSGQPVSFSEIFSHLVSTLGYPNLVSLCSSVAGVTTFGQYVDAAIAFELISLVRGTTNSRDALVSLRLGSPDSTSPPTQPTVSTTPPPSRPPREIIVSPPPVNVTPSSFRDLVVVLKELQMSTGKSVFRFPSVTPLLLGRKPDAFASVGVAEFADYVTLAMKNGVVRVAGMDQGDGWVSLGGSGGPDVSLQPNKSSVGGVSATPPPPVSSKGSGVDPKFADLVETLGGLWRRGATKPLLARVGSEMMLIPGSRARTLNASGANNFKAYAKLAKEAGIVEIHGPAGGETMSLDPTIRMKAGYT